MSRFRLFEWLSQASRWGVFTLAPTPCDVTVRDSRPSKEQSGAKYLRLERLVAKLMILERDEVDNIT